MDEFMSCEELKAIHEHAECGFPFDEAEEDVIKLLRYVDFLENMPFVQMIIKLRKDNERLKSARGADKNHCHHRYLLAENCPYCEASRKIALKNEHLKRENERLQKSSKLVTHAHVKRVKYSEHLEDKNHRLSEALKSINHLVANHEELRPLMSEHNIWNDIEQIACQALESANS